MRSTEGGPDRGTDEDAAGLQSFAVLLRRMNSEFNRIAHEFAHEQDLHPTDVQALIAILDADYGEPGTAMTPGRLREQLNLTSGAVTACLDRLERTGHIRRVRDGGDRRVVHLHYAARRWRWPATSSGRWPRAPRRRGASSTRRSCGRSPASSRR